MVHVILTGRNAHPDLVAIADTVTEMRQVKHAYEKGILAQRGIEFWSPEGPDSILGRRFSRVLARRRRRTSETFPRFTFTYETMTCPARPTGTEPPDAAAAA